ncbi:NAD(P)/FAD-dependent oxidoreductase [Natrarchaeobius sp. A-rgal3]|uniref:NAD(P)/FAD-dependent oxidoreductase n=1 Tax=Natrarchaeobius versutus TaxID=1679078 RepID=UPI00350EB576
MEIVIVGGGIVGTAIASRLGPTDHDVTLVERSSVGGETTAASAGIVMRSAVSPDPTTLSLRERSRSIYDELFDTGAVDSTRTGTLYVAETEAFADRLADAARVLPEHGIEARVVDGEDLEQLGIDPGALTHLKGDSRTLEQPGDDTGTPEQPGDDPEATDRNAVDAVGAIRALYTPDDQLCEPVDLSTWFADRARECGVGIRTGETVTAVETRSSSVSSVETDHDRLEADAVVNAAGPWAPALNAMVGVSLPLRHTLGPMVELEGDGSVDHPVTILESKRYVRPVSASMGSRSSEPESEMERSSGRSDAERSSSTERSSGPDTGRVWVGKYETAYGDGHRYDPDDVAVPASFRDSAPAMATLAGLEDPSIVDEWVGLRTVTPDGLPLVGETDVSGFVVACGMTGQGITVAPAVADVVKAVLEEPDDGDDFDRTLLEALSPDRF